jgi:hypothetical protein
MTVARYRPKRQERLILRPIGEEIRGVRRTALLNPARPSILMTFRPWPRPLQIQATRSGTRSTSSSRKSKSRSSNWNETNCSRRRTRSTSSWRTRKPTKGKSSRWSRSTSNRRSNCSKNTNRNNSNCSKDSSQRTGGPRGKIVLGRESPNLNSRLHHLFGQTSSSGGWGSQIGTYSAPPAAAPEAQAH